MSRRRQAAAYVSVDDLRAAVRVRIERLRDDAGYDSDAALAAKVWPDKSPSAAKSALSRIMCRGWIDKPETALALMRALDATAADLAPPGGAS